jgi:6-phosphofructokinase
MMDDALTTAGIIEAAAVLTLEVRDHVSHAALEQATIHVEQVLGDHASDIAPGASACADFENETIEIDVTLVERSSAELHQQLATIIDALDRHIPLCVGEEPHNNLTLTASATRVVPPYDIAA